ncbi:MAG: metallophosphoesterase family protein [Solirubrobacteraceae bacterium]
MIVGLISDAHANVFGLEAALGGLHEGGATEILFAGDAVGYHRFVNETIDILRDRGVRAIKGNHDAMLLGELEVAAERRTQYLLDYAARVIRPDNLEWLRSLPESLGLTLGGLPVSVYHGSPWAPLTEYVYPDHEAFERFAELSPGLVVLGHTHRPFTRAVGDVMIVNPGSCGLPRDGIRGASYALLDTRTAQVAHERILYDDQLLDSCP